MSATDFRARIRKSLANETLQIALDANAERRINGCQRQPAQALRGQPKMTKHQRVHQPKVSQIYPDRNPQRRPGVAGGTQRSQIVVFCCAWVGLKGDFSLGVELPQLANRLDDIADRLRRHQRGRAAAEKDGVEVDVDFLDD